MRRHILFSYIICTILFSFLCQSAFSQLQVDENGWTVIKPSRDSKIIYVSSTVGNDNNDGSSPATAIATIEKAKQLVRDGYPDHILLKRGDNWILKEGLEAFYSGRSAAEPMVVGYYGEQGDRPLIKTEKSLVHIQDKNRSHLAFIGLELYAYKHDPNSPVYESPNGFSGISYINAGGENLLIEDCKFNYMQMGAYTTRPNDNGGLKNFKFRRNIIIHSWAGDSYFIHELRTRVQGMYISGVDGILIEENLFDHNGWDEQIDGAGATMYNHNIYMSEQNPNAAKIIVRNNILARASAHGLQLRSGGTVENNLFIQNAINLNLGYHVNTSMKGAYAVAKNNVFQEVRLMDSLNTKNPRTDAVRGIGEITIPSVIESNIFSNCINKAQFGIDRYNDKWGFGGSLEQKNNIVYKWTNKSDKPNPEWPNPDITIADYHKSIGGEPSTIAFLLEARKRPLNTLWPQYEARTVNDFFRDGFNLPEAKPESAPATESNIYQGNSLKSIRIPAGGVGTGNLLLGGRGNIEFVEVFNRPDRLRHLEKTFFSLHVKEEGKKPVSTLLERELLPPFPDVTQSFAWGLPRMSEARFTNNYPHLQWQFQDESVPVDVSLEVLNPIVPLDFESSNFPVCKFNWVIKNPTENTIEASIALSMENPIKAKQIANRFFSENGIQGIKFSCEGEDVPADFQGNFFMGVTSPVYEVQTHWYPGRWRDETHIFWDDFSDDGHINIEKEEWKTTYKQTSYNESTKRMATVLVPFTLKPGEEISIPFYLSWYFPKRTFTSAEVFGIKDAEGKVFENYYAKNFKDEIDVLRQYFSKEKEIQAKAGAFARIMGNSSFPNYVIEALNSQVATLASPLIQITSEGDVHGFEGVLEKGWCCPGTCTHVWNYEQTLASLFPSLERKMREIEFLHNTFEDGFQAHRSVIPLGDYWFNGPAAADGQIGTIIRAYREWKLYGDNEWLSKLWPQIKKALEFAWTGSGESSKEKVGGNQQAWDPKKTGLLSNKQHNTYDIDFYGPNSLTSSLYLAALKAGSEMAQSMGEKKKSKEYMDVYLKGSRLFVDSLWNGEYFVQIISDDISKYKESELSPPDKNGKRLPKYQYGNGCLSDQLLGQYLAFTSGLGYIADKEKIDNALMSIYKNNFLKNLREFSNVQRVYGLNNEAGMVLCTWPNGDRPLLPFVYSDEIWTGVEFQVAASLIYSGKINEGLEIVKAIQDRHNGLKRNPFEHNESGVHYARALASWSLLPALSGSEYDGINKEFSFIPRINQSVFRSFWSTNSAWGNIVINEKGVKIEVVHGTLSLRKLSIQNPSDNTMKIWKFKGEKNISEGQTFDLSFSD